MMLLRRWIGHPTRLARRRRSTLWFPVRCRTPTVTALLRGNTIGGSRSTRSCRRGTKDVSSMFGRRCEWWRSIPRRTRVETPPAEIGSQASTYRGSSSDCTRNRSTTRTVVLMRRQGRRGGSTQRGWLRTVTCSGRLGRRSPRRWLLRPRGKRAVRVHGLQCNSNVSSMFLCRSFNGDNPRTTGYHNAFLVLSTKMENERMRKCRGVRNRSARRLPVFRHMTRETKLESALRRATPIRPWG